MNLVKPLRTVASLLYSMLLRSRFLLSPQRSRSFTKTRIGHVYVINLNRETVRWADVSRELNHIVSGSGENLKNQSTRFSAIDAREIQEDILDHKHVYPFYTLADQLYVEPQPSVLPDEFELYRPIKMSLSEIAVAQSHLRVCQLIAEGPHAYTLVLEDDVYFERGFGTLLDTAWAEMSNLDQTEPQFDILYLSYKEVKNGARKTYLSTNVFRPERGLWYFSGYVLSKKGAIKLLELLPCRGPIDLWINHLFNKLDVRAVRKSIIGQRNDLNSSNSYSILPSLTKIGVIDSEGAALFHERPRSQPVFAFGPEGSGSSSLAMALSMLGYRCCSDLDKLPTYELDSLLAGSANRTFNAYVNVGCLVQHISTLRMNYPKAKFIFTTSEPTCNEAHAYSLPHSLEGAESVVLHSDEKRKWRVICEHLQCAPPVCPYPIIEDSGQDELLDEEAEVAPRCVEKILKHDASPWVIEPNSAWPGIRSRRIASQASGDEPRVMFHDSLECIDTERWLLRDDTFPGNLALFRPANITARTGSGVTLTVKEESLGVRELSAAAISSRQKFLYGRFEVSMQATRIPGLVTGFFLHRDTPRQEIDIEIVGNRSGHLLVNVFYNPGGDGAKFDYGYRGTPILIPLGFDAADALHTYAIEWSPSEIKWFVDGRLMHRRGVWDPTPIPHLPMTLHVNNWPTRSSELAGRLSRRGLPGVAFVESLTVDSTVAMPIPDSMGALAIL